MGYWSDKAIEEAEGHPWALALLCEAGALNECDHHPGTYFEGDAPIEGAYRLVNARITSGEFVLPAGETRRDATDLLRSVYDDHAYASGCSACDKNFSDD